MARLNLETFPKSGSAFTAAALKLSFPNHEVYWGYQQRTNLKIANNCLTIIRNPKDAAPSCMVFFGGKYNDTDQVLNWYFRFMEWTYLYRDRIHVGLFEDVIKDPMSVISEYSDKFNLNPLIVEKEEIIKSTKKTHPSHLPSIFTEDRLIANELVRKSKNLPKALSMYEKVREYAQEIRRNK